MTEESYLASTSEHCMHVSMCIYLHRICYLPTTTITPITHTQNINETI